MILVDILVPALDKTYDFELNEEVKIKNLIESIVTLLGKDETENQMYLYTFDKERILSGEMSLKEQGVLSGEKLLLI